MAHWKVLVFAVMALSIASTVVQSKKRRGRNNSPDHGGSDPFNPHAGYKSWLSFKNLATTPGDRGKGGKVVCKCPRGPPGPSGPRGPPGAEMTEAHLLAKFRSLIRESAHKRSTRMREIADQALALMATGAVDLVSAFHIELKNNVHLPKKSMVELKNYKTNLGQYGTFVRGEDIDFRSGQFTVPYTAIYRFAAGINIARQRDASLRPRDLIKVLICIEYQCDKNTGLSFPLNSVGVLPIDYLDNSEPYKVDNLLTNAKQILAQYQIKEQTKRESSLVFRQFPELTGSMQVAYLRDVATSTKAGEYQKALNLSRHLITLSLKGLNYYQKYDRFLLSVIVTLGFLGWIGCVILQVFQESPVQGPTKDKKIAAKNSVVNRIFLCIGSITVVLLQIEKAPIMHYLYCLIPLICWNYVARQYVSLRKTWVFSVSSRTVRLFLSLLVGLIGLEVLVLSFFYRYILSVGLVLLASWPLATPLYKTHPLSVVLWILHCLMLSCFPLLPVVGRDPNYPLVTLAAILAFVGVVVILLAYRRNQRELHRRTKIVFGVQLLILVGAIIVLNHTVYRLSLKRGLPRLSKMFSWSTIVSCVILPTLSSGFLVLRLLSTTISLMSVYFLLSTSYEGLFLVVLASTMAVWLTLEHQLSHVNDHVLAKDDRSKTNERPSPLSRILVHDPQDSRARRVSFDDLRCAFFFVFFIIVAFFGTGNIASINSFDPSAVYCFLTVFSPFVMGSLLLLKVVTPFVVVTCVFDAVHVVCRVPVNRLFLLVLVMTDLMALQFFYLVQDHGSWLEIGTSISHYVILLACIIFLLIIFGVARYFTRSTWWTHASSKRHFQ